MTPAFGPSPSPSAAPVTWTKGSWTSQVCLNNLGRFTAGIDKSWGFLTWDEENTEDETEAYIRVDILDSTGTALVSGLTRRSDGHDLSTYAAIAETDDIKVRVNCYGRTKKPICKNLSMTFKAGGL